MATSAALWARHSLSRNDSRLMIVSNRPKVMDAEYLLDTQESPLIEYIRTSESFAESLAKQFKFDIEKPDSIHYILFKGERAERLLTQSEAKTLFSSITTRTSLAKAFPYIPACISFGIALGLLQPITSGILLASTIGLTLLSITKYVTACPTCPIATIAGIDAAIIGMCIYGGLSGLVAFKPTLTIRLGVLSIIALSLIWQLFSWYQTRLQCLPCSAIGLLSGLLLASSDNLFSHSSQLRHSKLAILIVTALSTAIFAYQGGFSKEVITATAPSKHLTALGMAKTPNIKKSSELGLSPPGKYSIFLIGSYGCHACDYASKALSISGLKYVQFYATTKEMPDNQHAWQILPKPLLITSTPTTILVHPDGSIEELIVGASDNNEWRRSYLNKLTIFDNRNLKR